MALPASHLVEQVIRPVGARQPVLSTPIRVRVLPTARHAHWCWLRAAFGPHAVELRPADAATQAESAAQAVVRGAATAPDAGKWPSGRQRPGRLRRRVWNVLDRF